MLAAINSLSFLVVPIEVRFTYKTEKIIFYKFSTGSPKRRSYSLEFFLTIYISL